MNPSPKTLTGNLLIDNKGACDWGCQGFLAYGCKTYAVIIDPKTLQIIQTVGPQKGFINVVRWSGEDYHHAFATGSTYNLYLACADTSGDVVIWDVVSGQVRTELSDASATKAVIDIQWLRGHATSHDLVVVLRHPDLLELWDGFTGVRLWRKSFGENLLSMTLDPFDIQRLICLSEHPHLVVATDVTVTKEPSSLRTVQFSDPSPKQTGQRRFSNGSVASEKSLTRNSSSLSKMASLATNILTTQDSSKRRGTTDDTECTTSCIQAVFSPAHQNMVFLVFPTEIQIIDVEVDLAVHALRLDKSSPSFVKCLPCRNVDMFFCLHENGSASVRVRKQSNKFQGENREDEMIDFSYDVKCHSDSLRLLRHCKVYNFVYHPFTEKQVALVLSDSRIIFIDILTSEYSSHGPCLTQRKPALTLADSTCGKKIVTLVNDALRSREKITLRMVTAGLISGIASPVTVLEMAPSVNDNHGVGKCVAVGSEHGSVQLVDLYSGQVETEVKLFTSPVRGIVWVNTTHLLVHSYPDPPSYGNRTIQSEMVDLNIKSGQTTSIVDRSEAKGQLLQVTLSPSRTYCVMIYKEKEMELWNINSRQLLREILTPEFIRPTFASWYNVVTWKSTRMERPDNNGRLRKMVKRESLEQFFVTGQLIDNNAVTRLTVCDGVITEPTVLTNENLFGIFAPKTEIVTMRWQTHYLLIGDRAGNVYLNNAKEGRHHARKIVDKRGFEIRSIQFAPGKINMQFFVQYSDCVFVYILHPETYSADLLATSPTLGSEMVDLTWCGETSVAIATEDGCIHVVDICCKTPISPVTSTNAEIDDFVHVREGSMKNSVSSVSKWQLNGSFSPAFLEPKMTTLLKYSLQTNIKPYNIEVTKLIDQLERNVVHFIQDKNTNISERCLMVARMFGDEHDVNFWQQEDISKDIDIPSIISSLATEKAEPKLIDFDSAEGTTDTDVEDSQTDNEMDITLSNRFDTDPSLVSCFGDMMMSEDFKVYESQKLYLLNKHRIDMRVKELCSQRWIMLNKIDMAVSVLMETDLEQSQFKTDCLKACLASSVNQTSTYLSTMKLAATHLIVAGFISDGVELLCLINRRLDACKYLISYGRWREALWLAKASLSQGECLQVVCKWAEYLWNSDRKSKAILVMLSAQQYVMVLRMLCAQRHFDTAALFLASCVERGVLTRTKSTERIYLEFAKLLSVTNYTSAVNQYCDLAGESGVHFRDTQNE
ncbi:WD repeat-containing protein 11-like isoform X2 [Mya arenaria]|uniref:WD repeat-containing protein 11-like isoform X2 n=1 Tax=Mya arenaria TaxID=6604 RepID=UPI0022E32E5F|nr:WD repeat-containing protein 11-like isoform X2 [Mya arenaria]